MTLFERYAFVAITSTDLAAARRFWVDQLGCAVTEDRPGEFFIVDAGGLRLCIDRPDGGVHRAGGSDPTIGLKVAAVDAVLTALAARRWEERPQIVHAGRGRSVMLTEGD
jgi:catechol 2,3-dioxygenase-like lactoylglutathione lyase family enzyme